MRADLMYAPLPYRKQENCYQHYFASVTTQHTCASHVPIVHIRLFATHVKSSLLRSVQDTVQRLLTLRTSACFQNQ
jgi:hypothetical protein